MIMIIVLHRIQYCRHPFQYNWKLSIKWLWILLFCCVIQAIGLAQSFAHTLRSRMVQSSLTLSIEMSSGEDTMTNFDWIGQNKFGIKLLMKRIHWFYHDILREFNRQIHFLSDSIAWVCLVHEVTLMFYLRCRWCRVFGLPPINYTTWIIADCVWNPLSVQRTSFWFHLWTFCVVILLARTLISKRYANSFFSFFSFQRIDRKFRCISEHVIIRQQMRIYHGDHHAVDNCGMSKILIYHYSISITWLV